MAWTFIDYRRLHVVDRLLTSLKQEEPQIPINKGGEARDTHYIG